MELGLTGKVVLITGGSRGIGKAIARSFLEEGALVAIAARSLQDLEIAKTELGYIRIYQGDLTLASNREQVFHSVLKDYGRLDILINNVGGSNGGPAMETDMALFEQSMQLNYFSAVHFSQLAAQEMRKTGGGSIINISSIFGRESGGKITYNNSKAALISFTKAFANEMISDGIRVNGIAPGSILHPSGNWQKRLDQNPEQILKFVEEEIPAGRFGTVEEVANVAVFLASDKASWIIGATLNVDGGQSKSNF
ncbi:SDR family NAD(P)-dependent oxidoreductase [Ammoniphilus sp. CFH 90114]|uniref:SDR family NAD(P)-dependent oxidoreductase n=1 Tax=Ammoniphilus sp. CFH 90114 TaxID=2493665 RepID=UPI00100D9ECA|nr:SDR family oxidoreductase [Ammoniphilus sp. CFH 90114]RXT06500.1 SDR family oxidoreductase [Ammoniphilus sp. CFH 90114]